MRPLYVAAAVSFVCVPARAQVHYDLGALGSFQQRFLSNGVAEGGALTLDGHVALFPLLRVGGWVTGEVSKPLDSPVTRELVGGGVRFKVVPPWPRGVWRTWFATGFGYAGTITQGAAGAGGGFFEVPVIIGASYRIRKPLVFLMELGARFGFGFWGSYYAAPPINGTDTASITLSFGLGIDQ